jgi:peptidoglycan hydrolase-like protein with peptidoglycan-binding domain
MEVGKDRTNFGPKTEATVKEFQRKNGLKEDGIVGPETKKKLGM